MTAKVKIGIVMMINQRGHRTDGLWRSLAVLSLRLKGIRSPIHNTRKRSLHQLQYKSSSRYKVQIFDLTCQLLKGQSAPHSAKKGNNSKSSCQHKTPTSQIVSPQYATTENKPSWSSPAEPSPRLYYIKHRSVCN